MNLTHFGHACIWIVSDDAAGDAATGVLVDPGNLAGDIAAAPAAIVITHGHEDHLDTGKIVATFGTDVPVYGPADVQERLREAGLDGHVIADGDVLNLGGLTIAVSERAHESIHAELPVPTNLALTIDGRVYHPGDSLADPGADVGVLLLPLGAPWLKLSEIIDFTRAVAPRLVIPIHQGGLAAAHVGLHTGLLTKLGGADVRSPERGVATEV